jgi:hypothetical protein
MKTELERDAVFMDMYIPRTLQELSMEDIYKLRRNNHDDAIFMNLVGLNDEALEKAREEKQEKKRLEKEAEEAEARKLREEQDKEKAIAMEVNRVAVKSNGEDNYDEEKNVSGANDGAQSAASTVNSQTTTQ